MPLLDGVLVAGAAGVELALESLLVVLVVVVLALDELAEVLLELLELSLNPPFLLLAPLYRSPYQPLPFKIKLPCVICREASSFPQLGHSLIGSSEMR